MFFFIVMIALLRPCWPTPTTRAEQNDAGGCCEQFSYCLIPPFIWILILFLDGDYLACCLTKSEGNYVFDQEINIKWCQPIVLTSKGNMSDLRRDYHKSIWISQVKPVLLSSQSMFNV